MSHDLSRVAVALGGDRAGHGHYATELAALAPEFLNHILEDVRIHNPLHYRRHGEGNKAGLVVYSEGRDRKDDGGTGEGIENGDIAMRLGISARKP